MSSSARPRFIKIDTPSFGFVDPPRPPPPRRRSSSVEVKVEPEIVERPDGTSIFLKRQHNQCFAQGEFPTARPALLEGRITEEEYHDSINGLNHTLTQLPTLWVGYLPCLLCTIIGVPLIFILLLGISISDDVFLPTVGFWVFFFVFTILGFCFYFYKEQRLEEVIRSCNQDRQDLKWRRGKGRRHEDVEILLKGNRLDVEDLEDEETGVHEEEEEKEEEKAEGEEEEKAEGEEEEKAEGEEEEKAEEEEEEKADTAVEVPTEVAASAAGGEGTGEVDAQI